MIKIKHLLEPVEPDDGARIWIEPIGLTRDLQEWCEVHHVLCHLGPPKGLCDWFDEHPDGYDYFRATYHEWLQNKSGFLRALQSLACSGIQQNYTLLHQGDDPAHNTGTALYEFLCALQSYCRPDGEH